MLGLDAFWLGYVRRLEDVRVLARRLWPKIGHKWRSESPVGHCGWRGDTVAMISANIGHPPRPDGIGWLCWRPLWMHVAKPHTTYGIGADATF